MSHPESRVQVTRIEFKDSRTPYSPRFQDVYFAPSSGIEESTYVYLEGSGFINSLNQGTPHLTIAEIGFGVGLNFLLTWDRFKKTAKPEQTLDYFSFEKYPVHRDDLTRLYAAYPELHSVSSALFTQYPVLTPGVHRLRLDGGRVNLILALGDASDLLPKLHFKADHWFWDGFAPSRNPEAFSDALFLEVARHSKAHARGASFTAAGWVRRSLEENGFKVTKRDGFGHKRECISGVFEGQETPFSIAPWFSPRSLKRVNPKADRIAVIGAGLAGSAIARALAERGARVIVFDPTGVAGRASGNPVGLFNTQISKRPNPVSRFSQTALMHLLRELETLKITTHLGIQRTDAHDSAPFLNSDYPESFFELGTRGTFFPLCGILSPKLLCETRLDHPNIEIRKIAVSQVSKQEDLFVLHSPERAPSEPMHHVVYALGADPKLQEVTHLDHPLLEALPTRPIRGQILILNPNEHSKSLPHSLVEEGYLTPLAPKVTGREIHVLGATYQAKTIAEDQEEIDTGTLLTDSKKWPEARGFSQESVDSIRVAHRLSTPDKLPLIGPLVNPEFLRQHYLKALRGAKNESPRDLLPEPGEWLLTGLGSRGITYSSYGAEILASMMLGEPLPLEMDLIEHLHPARFFVRNLRKPGLE